MILFCTGIVSWFLFSLPFRRDLWDNLIMIKNKLFSKEGMFKIILLALVFSIPFGTKKFIFSFFGAPSEEHSFFVFGVDIAIFLLLFFAWRLDLFDGIWKFAKKYRAPMLALGGFVLFAFVSIFFSPLPMLAAYTFVRLVLVTLFFFYVALSFGRGTVSLRAVAGALGASAVFQSLVSFFQFLFQGSVGLSFLGESVITKTTEGVARIYVEGAHLLRVYGTMPHANILAGFLVIGLLALVYLWMEDRHLPGAGKKKFSFEFYRHLAIAVGIFFVLLALVLTFSRSGWIVAVIGVGGMLLMGLFKKEGKVKTGYLSILLTLVIAFLGYLMWFAISPRVERLTMDDPSVQYRVLYNELGGKLVSLHPFGVGIGSQSLVSINEGLYTDLGITRAVDWQPIHNLYLLISTEIGILGAACFLLFIVFVVWGGLKILEEEKKIHLPHPIELNLRVASMILLSVLVFGLFDHFLWTLESGRLMLWLALAILFGVEVRATRAD